MNIIEREHDTLMELGNKLDNRIKILFSFETIGSLPLIAMGVGYTQKSIKDGLYGFVPFSIIIGLVGCIVFVRYLVRILRKESLVITKDTFTIISSVLGKKKEVTYDNAKITDLNYYGKAKKTDHPLKGKSFDYLGFDTQEYVIAEVNDDGNLSFRYNHKKVYFGKNVYSWDADKINEVLSRVTSGHLKIGNLPGAISEEEYSAAPEQNIDNVNEHNV